MPDKPLVFISCGQYASEEIALGKEIERFIRDETPFEPYFAEQQNTLEGLVSNVLTALNEAAGFVGIMHYRGTLATPTGSNVIRGSVWIEQEVAIAAFIQHTLKREIEVALYIQEGIEREGIRQQLRLNPVIFTNGDEVLSDLRSRIKGWHIAAINSAEAIVDKWVTTEYAEKAGIGTNLDQEGYTSDWVYANKENERVDLDGWEYVLVDQGDGTRARLKMHEHPAFGGYIVLLKKKQV